MITIDITGRTPIYEQIYRAVCSEITRGVYKENDKIPPSRVLAQQLGLNPNTVTKAYQMLERDGIIYSVTGKGSFVAGSANPNGALTRHFENKVREMLKAGVPADDLVRIIENVKGEFEK